MEKTDWYPATVNPVRVGVYETKAGFQHWNGEYWGASSASKLLAQGLSCYRSRVSPNPVWRGLTSEQK